jgi:hypothetical protein
VSLRQGWQVQSVFQIHLHINDLALLKLIQSFFGVGKIRISKKGDSAIFVVESLADIKKAIIPHFDKYPLLTKKKADFLLFKLAIKLISLKEHLTIEGLQKIVNIRASMNLGLSEELTKAFPNTNPIDRPNVAEKSSLILNPYWIAGFFSGEGCFYVGVGKSETHKLGSKVQLRFEVAQHSRDAELIKSLVHYFKCGNYHKRSTQSASVFYVSRLPDIIQKIIPFFDQYSLQGGKYKDFADFKRAATIVKKKEHLTVDGLEQIVKIKAGMNRGRSSYVGDSPPLR